MEAILDEIRKLEGKIEKHYIKLGKTKDLRAIAVINAEILREQRIIEGLRERLRERSSSKSKSKSPSKSLSRKRSMKTVKESRISRVKTKSGKVIPLRYEDFYSYVEVPSIIDGGKRRN
jgi:hypothetical protein